MNLPKIEWLENGENISVYNGVIWATHRMCRIAIPSFDTRNIPPHLQNIEPYPDRHGFDALGLVGRINREPVRFANHIALSETLLLSTLRIGILSDGVAHDCYAEFCWLNTRGVCEDGKTRFTGWNRLYRPNTQRWERVTDADNKINIYTFAEDVGGFEQLWIE